MIASGVLDHLPGHVRSNVEAALKMRVRGSARAGFVARSLLEGSRRAGEEKGQYPPGSSCNGTPLHLETRATARSNSLLRNGAITGTVHLADGAVLCHAEQRKDASSGQRTQVVGRDQRAGLFLPAKSCRRD